MMNDGIDLAVLDPLEQRLHVAMHVRLPGLHRERLVHDRADRNLVDEAAVDAGHRDGAAVAAGHDRLAQRARPIRLQPHRLLHPVVGADDPCMCASMPTASMHASGPRPPVISLQRLEHVDLLRS